MIAVCPKSDEDLYIGDQPVDWRDFGRRKILAQSTFKQGTPISGLIWNRIWATNPDVELMLDASMDDNAITLMRLERRIVVQSSPGSGLNHKG